ncbi:glycosyltransferase family 2 protein [Candidatus Woesearchaeota archaeon]|nr:glycosyltransferase family 2 protein [Candidatus Woesearchaeota archaeon]
MGGKGVYIVIAAYNEEAMLDQVIKALKKHGHRNIVVVDDGSKDNTYNVAKANNVYVLRHVLNRGQGAALQTGIDFALLKGAEIIVTFDADGQHQPKDISDLLKPIQDGKADVTLGSRFLKETSQIPKSRRVYLKIGAFILLIMYGIRLTDSHNGLRAFSRDAAEKIQIRSDGMDHASEIPELIKKKRLRFKEVPVDIRYTEYSLKHGQPNSNAFKIFYHMLLRKLLR